MKRIGNLFGKITDINNITRAHLNARKGKTHYREVKMVDKDVLGYCTKIQQMLINKTYTTSKYHTFEINDRGKQRDICELPYYPDRMVHWAILQVIEGIFCKHFIDQTYAAIPNKGTHKAKTKLEEYMKDREGAKYCLKLDVKKFFPSIKPEILKALLRSKIKCNDTLWLLDDIIDSYDKGIPIGNYTSQYFGNYYLSFFDHWIKEVKKVKYYMRYMDDIVILHNSKEYLRQIRKDIDAYLRVNLELCVKENWQVFPAFKRGVDFVGYRCFGDYTLLRNATKKRLKAAVKRLGRKVNRGKSLNRSDQSRIGSYFGILSWCDSYRLSIKTINKFLGGHYETCKRNTKRAAA